MTFALGLFAFVHGQEEEQQRTVPVALVMRLPTASAQRELMTPIRASIHVTLLGIAAPPQRVRYIGPQAATVSVTVARRVSEVRFENRPIEVVGVPNGSVAPRTVDVIVAGPPEIVRALRPDQIVPVADLTKVEG